ncbi:hypothetical protein HK099_008051 [Clydaea vesicula]|uniref:Uncharacterized protein n=1 Tax=Clydaea vesicula TaxID=447962 RepID=A0AAD5XW20_9FUNG|nr:hypothetical protein HK099_008051 [Clydaea vesicula]KAJ3380485.1 hypothetical protein HDU92_005950 [Lobulomyces angularis]
MTIDLSKPKQLLSNWERDRIRHVNFDIPVYYLIILNLALDNQNRANDLLLSSSTSYQSLSFNQDQIINFTFTSDLFVSLRKKDFFNFFSLQSKFQSHDENFCILLKFLKEETKIKVLNYFIKNFKSVKYQKVLHYFGFSEDTPEDNEELQELKTLLSNLNWKLEDRFYFPSKDYENFNKILNKQENLTDCVTDNDISKLNQVTQLDLLEKLTKYIVDIKS